MYLAVLRAYGRSRNKLKVTSIFKEFESQHKLKSSHYGHYLTCLIDCGELTMARRVLQKIQYNPSIARTEVSTYIASFVSFCIKRDNLPLAIQFIQSHHGFDWDKQALSTVLQTLLPNHYQTPQSFETFISNSIETSVPTQHIPFTLFDLYSRQFLPTLNTCHLLIDLHIRQGDNKRLKSILIWMKQLGIQPNLETIDLLKPLNPLKGHVYKSCLKQLEKIEIDNITKLKQFIHSNTLEKEIGLRWLDTQPLNLDGHALLLENLLLKADWNQCILEFNRLQSRYPNIQTHRRCTQSFLISHFAKEDWMLSERILKEHSKLIRSTNIGFRILESMINLVSRTGQSLVPGNHVLKTLELIEQKLNIQFSAQDIAQIIRQLGNHGDIENGYRLYNYVRAMEGERCAELSIYRALMESATRNNDTRRLERAWVDMQYRERYIGNPEKQEPNLIMYNILFNGFASRLPRPDLSHVRKLYRRMLNQNLTPDIVTYNILIKSFVNANNMEAANQIFKKMTESGIEPDTYTTNTILNGWIIRKDWEHVENFIKDIQNHLHKLDIVTFNLLVQSFLQLDSKTMEYTHILKHQNKWKHVQELNEHQSGKQKLDSKKIWSIFESSTGYSKQSIIRNPDHQQAIIKRHPNAFINLFSKNTEPDHITYKLFMKAFDTIGDQKSHERIYQWMKYKQTTIDT
ncbi:hypothetical protein BD770DRAFT_393487 [Pilaira anomala]|nr:hypothetical protein BD770DRAFT_393487 [Pilaira anomala]